MGITRKTGMITLPLSAGADAAKTAASQPHALTNRQTGPTGAKPPLQPHEARDPVCGMTGKGRHRQMDRICCAASYVAHLRLGAVSRTIDSFYAT